MQWLADQGYRPTPGSLTRLLLDGGHSDRYLAGSDAARMDELISAFRGGADAVWMSRGGYGIARLLDGMPWDDLDPIPFLGFSDGTALLNPLAARGRPAVHAPVVQTLADHIDDASRSALAAFLAGDPAPMTGERWDDDPGSTVEGDLIGGNLCVLASLCGTPWQPQTAGKILLLEDVQEAPYRLDRMLTQLQGAGMLTGLRGVALGAFTGCSAPKDAAYTAEDVLRDLLCPLNVPILAGLPVGHGAQNRALPLGPVVLSGMEIRERTGSLRAGVSAITRSR
jgi:muramoyltetrapeptide carboxypeptidase